MLPSRPTLVIAVLAVGCLVAAQVVSSSRSDGPAAPALHNLLGGDTRALATGTGDWSSEGGRLAVRDRGVLAITSTVPGWTLTGSGRRVAARPGSVYRGSFAVRARGTSRTVLPYVSFYDRAGKVLVRVRGEAVADTSNAWRTVTPVVAIAPPRAASVALVSLTGRAAVGEVHYLRSPLLAVSTPARTDVVGPLRTSGNRVLDANGPVVLRGIHRVALEGGMGTSTGKNLTAEDLRQAERWGATMVRLSLSSAYWLPSSCHYDPGYADAVDAAVDAVTSAGMVALLDLHTGTRGTCGPVAQQVMADPSALPFWKSAAARYADDPLVAFDLYNEPHDISDRVWLSGGRVGDFVAVGMQQLYDAVRGTGARNLVFVSGNNWANTLPDARVRGENLVYGVHAYTCGAEVDPGACAPDPEDPGSILSSWVAPAERVPVVITEFGWPSKDSGRYLRNVIAFATARGWGWVAFAWDGTRDGRFSLLASAGPGADYEPSPAGMPVLEALALRQ